MELNSFFISELNYDEVVSKSPIGRLLFTDFCNETEELRCCNKFLNDVVSCTSNLDLLTFWGCEAGERVRCL